MVLVVRNKVVDIVNYINLNRKYLNNKIYSVYLQIHPCILDSKSIGIATNKKPIF